MMLFTIACCSSLVTVSGLPDETIQLMQSSMATVHQVNGVDNFVQAAVDSAGNIQNEVDASEANFENDVDAEMDEEGFPLCKIWYYSQSNCMFNLGSTAGNMAQYGRKMKSFRMTRSSKPASAACRVESYSEKGFTGTKTVHTVDDCVKTSNAYGPSKSYKLIGPTTSTTTPPPACTPGNMHSYWVGKFKAQIADMATINKICYANSQWYFDGKSTKVGQGGWNKNCDTKNLKCMRGGTFGWGSQQAAGVAAAIANGGVHPQAPSLAQFEAEIEVVSDVEVSSTESGKAVEAEAMLEAERAVDNMKQKLKDEIKRELKNEFVASVPGCPCFRYGKCRPGCRCCP